MSKEFIQILVSFPSKSSADKVAKKILQERLAGCIQIFPISSKFWWKGKIEITKEWLCFIKTKKILYKKVEKLVKELHPYTVPEIISFKIENGNKDYLKWLLEETK